MQVYLVSIRTATIYGPGEILEAFNPRGHWMNLNVHWEHEDVLDEWEGYAVVVPERKQVWGLANPQLDEQVLSSEFAFSPQPIPAKDQKLFDQKMQEQQASSSSEEKADSDQD